MLLTSIPSNSDSGRSSCYPVVWIPGAHCRWVWCREVLENHWTSSGLSDPLRHLEFLKATDDRAVWHGHKAETALWQPARQAHDTHPSSPLTRPASPIGLVLSLPSGFSRSGSIGRLNPRAHWMGRTVSLGREIKNKQINKQVQIVISRKIISDKTASGQELEQNSSFLVLRHWPPLNAYYSSFSRSLMDTVLPRPRGPTIAFSPQFTGRTEPSCLGD